MVKKLGFTLLELLIVIGLIGILVSVAAVSYSSAQKKARDTRRMADMKAVQDGIEQYYADHSGLYPADEAALTEGGIYLPNGIPADPKGVNPYTINYDTSSYCACAALEGTLTGGNATDESCTFAPGAYYCVKNLQ